MVDPSRVIEMNWDEESMASLNSSDQPAFITNLPKPVIYRGPDDTDTPSVISSRRRRRTTGRSKSPGPKKDGELPRVSSGVSSVRSRSSRSSRNSKGGKRGRSASRNRSPVRQGRSPSRTETALGHRRRVSSSRRSDNGKSGSKGSSGNSLGEGLITKPARTRGGRGRTTSNPRAGAISSGTSSVKRRSFTHIDDPDFEDVPDEERKANGLHHKRVVSHTRRKSDTPEGLSLAELTKPAPPRY